MPQVLDRLDKAPIVEATFEYRFQGNVPNVADALQAELYSALKDRFPKIMRHPLADFSSALIDDPTLRYQPRLILQGDKVAIFIGDRSIAVTCAKPYLGWTQFKALIMQVLEHVKRAKVIRETERMSLRYINLLEAAEIPAQFSLVHYDATLGRAKYKLNAHLTYTRTEIPKDGLINIVELSANSNVKLLNEQLQGLVLTIDTIYANPPDFLNNPAPHVEKAHNTGKSIFLDVLTEETLKSMGPHWK